MRRIIAIMLLFSAGCSDSGPPVHFVLPNGYRGPFKLVVDKRKGVAVPLANGRYTFVIPRNGILRIKNESPLTTFHKETASFVDGTSIPWSEDPNTGPEQIALYGLFTDADDTMWWLIGTNAERSAAGKPIDLRVGKVTNRKKG